MAKLAGRFTGRELDRPVVLLAFETHLELAVTSDEGTVSIRVPLEEIATIQIQDVLGMPALVIEDTAGLTIGAVRMDAEEAARAKALIERLQFER